MVNQSKFRSVSNVVNLGQSSILAMCQDDDDWNLKSTGSEPISAVLSIMEKKNTKHFLLQQQQQLAIKAKQSLGNFNKSCSLVILLFSFGKMQLEYTTRHVIIIYNQLHQRPCGFSHSLFANKGAHFPIYKKTFEELQLE